LADHHEGRVFGQQGFRGRWRRAAGTEMLGSTFRAGVFAIALRVDGLAGMAEPLDVLPLDAAVSACTWARKWYGVAATQLSPRSFWI
jgi:hypothetical protein